MNERHLRIYALIGWLAIVILGATQVTNWSTDNFSDEVIFREMQEIAAGRHRYGIVNITHYPNGPGYLILPLLKLGVESDRLVRWVPFAFSIAACAFLISSLIGLPISRKGRALLLTAWLALALLPGYVYWQGDIHEHSYAMSLTLVTIALAMRFKRINPLWYLVIGFVAAWMGFDFLPVQVIAAFAVALTAEETLRANSRRGSWRHATLITALLVAGMITGILTHLAQNVLYFDSFNLAWNDLAGSAATRAGLDASAQAMSPQYYDFVAISMANAKHDSDRLLVTLAMTREFFLKWGSPLWTAFFLLVSLSIPAALLGKSHTRWQAWLQRFLIPLMVSFCASVAWIALMPKHSVAHFHFLPRHYIAGLMAFLVVTTLSASSSSSADQP